MNRDDLLRQEQDAFDRQLPDLLVEHKGEYVVMKDGRPVSFYATFNDAYAGALERFGLDEVFLISEVVQRIPEPVSVAWEAGVLIGC